MNCDLCEKNILATMQVAWNGGNYHADCIGEVLAQSRAKTEPSPYEMVEAKQALEEFEDEFPDDFEEDDFQDLLEEVEPIVPKVEPAQNNARNVIVPDIVQNVPAQTGGGNGTLMVHCGAQRISRADLSTLDLPEATATFKPIAHSTLVDVVEEALAFRHIRIVDQEFATSPDGMKLFGVLRVNADYEGVGICYRTSER